MSKDVDLFLQAGCLFSHTEQKGMAKCEYMWKHHPTKKSGKTIVWVTSFAHLITLCKFWRGQQPLNWFYLPLRICND